MENECLLDGGNSISRRRKERRDEKGGVMKGEGREEVLPCGARGILRIVPPDRLSETLTEEFISRRGGVSRAGARISDASRQRKERPQSEGIFPRLRVLRFWANFCVN